MIGLISYLEAVNKVLAVSGDEPLNTIDTDYPQVSIVNSILINNSRLVQSKGYWFNEVYNKKLIPNIENKVVLPENTIRASFLRDQGDFAQHGLEVFNKKTESYIFTQPIYADIVYMFEWDKLPQVAREYIIALSRLEYNQNHFNDENLKRDLKEAVYLTEVELKKQNIRNLDVNFLNNPTVRNILRRS